MLMQELGYRAPLPDEEARIATDSVEGTPIGVQIANPSLTVPAAVLSGNPIISYSGSMPQFPLGLASIAAAALGNRPAWFLISPTWSIEGDGVARSSHALAVAHRRDNPSHRLIFMGNTPNEAEALQKHHEAAFFCNKTIHVSEHVFRPLDDVPPEFDAIYNAQLIPWKRHELSLGIPSCAFLFYRDGLEQSAAAAEMEIMARHAAMPGHVFINTLDKDRQPARLPPPTVNRHLNRASVGLCLSEVEGAMFASTEYLLSGLPIVTTPSRGGRHIYHDAEYCLSVPPDPRSVGEAVQALKARRIPRAYIRNRTLQRLNRDRERFMALLNAILKEGGSARRFSGPWPFRKDVTMEWLPPQQALDRADFGIVDAFRRPRRGLMRWRRWKRALGLGREYKAG
jgi:hypothetical protein